MKIKLLIILFFIALKIFTQSTGGINANLRLWIGAKSGSESVNVQSVNLGSVDKWINKTTNACVAELNQTLIGRQPVFKENELNYNPIINFDGVNDQLNYDVLGI